MLLLARTSLFALTTGTRALRTSSVPRMAKQVPRPNLGSASESEAAYTIDGGYALAPAEDGTGGWLAHRSELDVPGSGPGDDWIRRVFDDPDGDLASAALFSPGRLSHPPRILLLYGSLRESSFSRRLAHECARILELLGADVRVYNPRGLPVRDPELDSHPKVRPTFLALRTLALALTLDLTLTRRCKRSHPSPSPNPDPDPNANPKVQALPPQR